MRLEESTPSEYQHVFREIAPQPRDAIIVSGTSELFPYRKLIVDLAEKKRLPAIHAFRDYVEAGGLMACETDLAELFRRMANDVQQILNGARPADIPIFQPTKFEFIINLTAAKALGLAIPSMLLATADEASNEAPPGRVRLSDQPDGNLEWQLRAKKRSPLRCQTTRLLSSIGSAKYTT
jgi:putative tryptophan/tyrosine transport system substrate-binding protein